MSAGRPRRDIEQYDFSIYATTGKKVPLKQPRSVDDQSSHKRSVADQPSQRRSVADQSSQRRSVADQSSQRRSVADQSSQPRSVDDQSSQPRSVADQSSQPRSVDDQSGQLLHQQSVPNLTQTDTDYTDSNSLSSDLNFDDITLQPIIQSVEVNKLSLETTLQSLDTHHSSLEQLISSIDSIRTETSNPSFTMASVMNKVILMSEEVNDIVDEVKVVGCPLTELNNTLQRLEGIRAQLRQHRLDVINNMASEEPTPEETKLLSFIQSTLDSIKAFVTASYTYKRQLNQREQDATKSSDDAKERRAKLSIDSIKQTIDNIKPSLISDFEDLSDAKLIQLKEASTSITNTVITISERYERLLQQDITDPTLLAELDEIGTAQKKLCESEAKYQADLDKETTSRDVYKQRVFDESKLNIKLDKFSGYESSMDIYTFQTAFNKIYKRTTPRHMLPDLLKNNLLKGSALSLVKTLDDIDTIWTRLKSAYGDTKLLLSKKLKSIIENESLGRRQDTEHLIDSLNNLINTLKELMSLAEQHHIEEHLFYGDGLNQIYRTIGSTRLTRWLTSISNDKLSPKTTWLRFIQFLEKELHLEQQKVLIYGSAEKKRQPPRQDQRGNRSNKGPSSNNTYQNGPPQDPTCSICDSSIGSNDHVATIGPNKMQLIQYFTCKQFAEMTPANRYSFLRKKGFCHQCLFPGANSTSGRHRDGKCQDTFICPHESHARYPVRKHVLVCEEHKTLPANQDVLQRFKDRYMKNANLPTFAKDINIYYSAFPTKSTPEDKDERGIYLLQSININNNRLTLFFDNGCSDFIVKKSAIPLLGGNATQTSSQPKRIGGVGCTSTMTTHGEYSVRLPMFNGEEAHVTGICMESITETFPQYPLEDVMKDIKQAHTTSGSTTKLPKPAATVGGDVHLMMGMKFIRYHPKLIYQLPSGLGIYESVFNNADGGRGVIGGPHEIFTAIHQTYFTDDKTFDFFTDQLKLYKWGIQTNPDIKRLSFTNKLKRFDEVESAGTITYRCMKCRNCKSCKESERIEMISIKEEAEQELINSSVTIDSNTQTVTAMLPLIKDPSRLAPNKDIATKVYNQQLRKLGKPENKQDKLDILASEKKLHSLGYVGYVQDLPPSQQEMLRSSSIQNFIPWRAVWKPSSISTPCRIVFDASQTTASGLSLNDILAKGSNNLNKLQEIMIRFQIRPVGIHSDVSKMYNTVKLHPDHWTLQRYLWQEELDPTKIPKEKVIKTLIYGIKSSGNQSEFALRRIAEMNKEEYPEVNEIIQHDVYVDDCITGDHTIEAAHKRADELQIVTSKGAFNLKGITISGKDPPSHLTEDGVSVGVGGMKWFSKDDELSLTIQELNFAPKRRGKKSTQTMNVIPKVLTRRHCSSKVAEVFDILGKVAPLVAAMKIDLRDLCDRQLNWDDPIPDELRPIWLSHFDTITQISQLRFQRLIVPTDAVSLDVETLDFGDASKTTMCICIYGRFLRKDGSYSSQLVFAKSRMVPKDLTLPRAELLASLINAHTGEIVRRSFRSFFKASLKFTDSQITLHWISNEQKMLKQWVRSRVVEIHRFTQKNQWRHIGSKQMIADVGTRKGATISDVDQHSQWMNGQPWMQLPISEFPAKRANEITLSNEELSEVNKEAQIKNIEVHVSFNSDESKKRYEFSSYILDPNRHSFHQVIRLMAYILRYCNNLRKAKPKLYGDLSEEELSSAEQYYFQKGTSEVKKFLKPSQYQKISREKNGILIYTGRILPQQEVTIVGKFTSAMKDLSQSSFCVPILEKNSPIALSIVMDVHWNHPTVKHSGIETTHRFVMMKVYIIEGRQLVKQVRESCERCRYLMKRTVDMAMGPVSIYNLTIAPAFYHTQIDLSGPYQAYHPHYKRTTVKVWLLVLCCCSTSAVSIKLMDDYSSPAFILAFTRFACDHGFPGKLLCDEGTQLVKGCKDMRLNFRNIKFQLKKERNVDFELCPVQGHNMHGKVERKIKEIDLSIQKNAHNERLSLMQWETLSATIANTINNLPLAVGNITGDFEVMDLITPNRLLLGRNNERNPDGIMVTSQNPSKVLRENEKIYEAWFEAWLMVHVPKLMHQTKWFKSDLINVGDIIIFQKVDSIICKTYTYGQVVELDHSADGLPRKATIRYQNPNENVFRTTNRAVRGLIIIHRADDSDVMTGLGKVAKDIDLNSK